MPVVSVPVQQAHSIIRSGFVPLEQAQFSIAFAAALVGPIALLALFVSFSRQYKTSSHPALPKVRSMRTFKEQLSKQPGELNLARIIMSASRKSEISSSGAHLTLNKDGPHGGRDQSQSPSGRQKYREEPGSLDGKTGEKRNVKARTPSPMPLTPPVPSTTIFSFEDRRLSVAASTHNDFDPTLTYGLNSDFNSPDSATAMGRDVRASSPISSRKSYTRILPFDPLQSSSSTTAALEETPSTFAPSSFPSSSPILPLAPHAALHSREVDVTGEIISAADDSGAGWQRHTRVYGGGVCLACLASGGHDGGFYGENVPLDQRR
ncbi:hypothetical protein F5Y09DRAFT_20651 [Xylaria sp. FL1042]|nr:hypothetical protein F5Y09DRAFT_20651 [Xylaria sp. FL1042]